MGIKLTKEERLKYTNKYFMDLQKWTPYRVKGLGKIKARILNLITGKVQFVDTGYFLKWFGGCDVQAVDWKPELHTKYLLVDRQKGAKSKFTVYVYKEGVVETESTFTALRNAWEFVEVVSKQYPGAELWFNHTREVSIKLTR